MESTALRNANECDRCGAAGSLEQPLWREPLVEDNVWELSIITGPTLSTTITK